MVERDLEQRLRGYFAAEVGDDSASSALIERVAGIPDASPAPAFFGDRRMVVLLAAAALLLAMLVGLALAVGSGLAPFRSDDIQSPAPSGLPAAFALPGLTYETGASFQGCDSALPDAADAFIWTTAPIAGQEPEQSMTWVFGDGQAVIAPLGASPDQAWSQRRLTEAGFDQLLGALVRPELPSCQSYDLGPNASDQLDLIVRGSSSIYSIGLWSGDPVSPHVTTPDQATAVDDLLAGLADPDFGLDSGAWADPSWTPYVSNTWQLQVDMTEGGGPPLTDQVQLPDGTPLLEAGDVDPTAQERGVSAARCAMVDEQTAKYVQAQLPAADMPPDTWDFSNASVTIAPVLPGARCGDTASATSSPTAVPSPVAASGTEVCSYLTSEEIQSALGDPKLATRSRADTSFDGWAACYYGSDYQSGGMLSPDPGSGSIMSSLQGVPGDQAAELARELLGSGISTIDIAGHQVFYNGCQPDTDAFGCKPSVAISADPDFIVVIWQGRSQDDLLALAAALLQKI